jgi:subtilisin family serine protease
MSSTSAFIEAQSVQFNGDKHYYGYMDGTSMATPYVTGVIATWLEHNWDLTPEEAADILAQTARNDEFTGSNLPNNEMGYGKIDAYKGMLKVLELYVGVEDVERAGAMMLYPNPTSGAFNIGFIRESSNVEVSVYSANGQLVMSEFVGDVMPGRDCEFVLDNVVNGAYIVRVAGENVNETFRLLVVK